MKLRCATKAFRDLLRYVACMCVFALLQLSLKYTFEKKDKRQRSSSDYDDYDGAGRHLKFSTADQAEAYLLLSNCFNCTHTHSCT